MRTRTYLGSPITYLMLAAMVMLVQACGQPVAKDQGCPSDTYLANSTDLIIATPDLDTFVESSSTASFLYPGGGTILPPPVTFEVIDQLSQPRPNVCLFAYTGNSGNSLGGPFWYTDANYSSQIIGPGPLNARVLVTDDTGVARVYWSSALLPPANPRLASGGTGTAITFTAGTDQEGVSYINVQSGAQSATFNAPWQVKGQPAQ